LWRTPGGIAAVVLLGLVVILVAVALNDARGPEPAVPPAADHVVAAPLDGRQDAQFELLNGATSVTVRAADIGAQLYRIGTPDESGAVPRVIDHDGRVELHLVPTGPAGRSAVEILLSTRVRWGLRIAGGAADEVLDMANGRLTAVDIVAGASRIDLSLPRPAGTVPVRLTGGASEFGLHAPAGVPTRVRVGSGAGSVTVNGVQRDGVSAGTVFAAAGWDAAVDRYDIQLASGVAAVTVDRR
jgi:hypothetical protein